MIRTVNGFINYFESIRRRTLTYIRTIPSHSDGWSPKTGEFTCGDIVRHLAAAETMFVGAVVEGKSCSMEDFALFPLWAIPFHYGDSR